MAVPKRIFKIFNPLLLTVRLYTSLFMTPTQHHKLELQKHILLGNYDLNSWILNGQVSSFTKWNIIYILYYIFYFLVVISLDLKMWNVLLYPHNVLCASSINRVLLTNRYLLSDILYYSKFFNSLYAMLLYPLHILLWCHYLRL